MIFKYIDLVTGNMTEDMGKTIISLHKRITIPNAVMEEMNLKKGDVVGFEKDDNGTITFVKYVKEQPKSGK